MASLFLIFNHSFTPEQKKDAQINLGIHNFIEMPRYLKEIWANIPPNLESISSFIDPIKKWLMENSSPFDFVLIQGELGASYILVNFAFQNSLIPIYSTTVRKAIEELQPDGSIKLVHCFKHERFRKYGV